MLLSNHSEHIRHSANYHQRPIYKPWKTQEGTGFQTKMDVSALGGVFILPVAILLTQQHHTFAKTGFKKPSEFGCGFCPRVQMDKLPKGANQQHRFLPPSVYNHSCGLTEQEWRKDV